MRASVRFATRWLARPASSVRADPDRPPRFGAERGLRTTLRAGAAYDLALGAAIVLAGERALGALGAEPPCSPFFFRLSALPLFLLPALYLAAAAARETRPFRAPVLFVRIVGGLLVAALALWYRPDAWGGYVAIGAADWIWAAVHAAWWRARAECGPPRAR